jgi:putative transcriptional regulator
MNKRDIGLEILQGIDEIKQFRYNKKHLKTRVFTEPSPVAEIRAKLNISQFDFANLIGVSAKTIKDWEQGRRNPTGAAKSLLRIAEQEPQVFTRIC